MKKLSVVLLLIFCTTAFAHKSNKDLDELHQQMNRQRISLDSTMKRIDSALLQPGKIADSESMARQAESNSRNLNAFMGSMKEREQKEKQRMWLRIGLGILLLVLGIIGMRRKSIPQKK